MVEIRGAQRPLLALGLGLCIATAGLWAASHIEPKKGNPQKECTETECTVNFPGDKRGQRTTGVGGTDVFGVPVYMGDLSPQRVELLIGVRTFYATMGQPREIAGMVVELKRTAPDGAIITFRKDPNARN
jgi:hypothetical protein